MKFVIRPFEERDVRGLNEIRRMRGVRDYSGAFIRKL